MSSIPPLRINKASVVSPQVRLKKTPAARGLSRSIATKASSTSRSSKDTPYRTPKQRRDSATSQQMEDAPFSKHVLTQLSPQIPRQRLSNQSEFSNRSENFIQRNIEHIKAMSLKKKAATTTTTTKENRLFASSRKQLLK